MKKDITNHIIIGATITTGVVILAFVIALIIRYMKASQVTEETLRRFADKSIPRGYRNNNPLNIRISNSNWLGKVSPNTDGAFEQFSDIKYGYRAAIKTLRSYYYKHGLRTVRDILNRWAPPSDSNNTDRYIGILSEKSGWKGVESRQSAAKPRRSPCYMDAHHGCYGHSRERRGLRQPTQCR